MSLPPATSNPIQPDEVPLKGISRKPVPVRDGSPTAFTQPMKDLSLITTASPESYFTTSPTTTVGPQDEIIGVGTSPDSIWSASKWKATFEDVRHYAGGLISHPYESNKHFAILRHSHGLVYYRGFLTNIAVTIFSDRELPADRQFWLQKRGFSGKTGLKIAASIGTKSAWINVTPSVTASAEQLSPANERAWQRDIKEFLHKAPKDLRNHTPRETDVLRIPHQAEDGYFRVVMCHGENGKKVLCPSPVFRLASTSTSGSSVRGASLSTLPVEMAIKIGQFAARTAATNAVAPLAQTVTGMIPYSQRAMTQTAASAAYDVTGIKSRIEKAEDQYTKSRQRSGTQTNTPFQDELGRPNIIGDESGPESPFPIRFASKVARGSGRSWAELGMPTANLSTVPADVLLRLSGTYFGWASIEAKDVDKPPDFLEEWYQAVITAAPRPDLNASVIVQKDLRVYLIQDLENLSFIDTTLSVILMGLLRPPVQNSPLDQIEDIEIRLLAAYKDIAATQASLSRPAWSAEDTLTLIKTSKSGRSMTERYMDVKSSGQRQVDRVPLHMAGIRTQSMGVWDQLVGNGGFSVPR